MASAQALVAELPSGAVAVPMASVHRVVDAPALTPVPAAPPALLGLANVRGEIVPVLDGGLLLGNAPVEMRYVVVVDTARGRAGLAVPLLPHPKQVDAADLFDPDTLTA